MKRFPIEELEKRIKEIDELIQKGDGQQAAEKVYSVVESCIKILAEKYNLPEYQKVQSSEKKAWLTYWLFDAAKKLAGKDKEDKEKKYKIDEKIWRIWNDAWNLHVWGFHEKYWDLEDIKERIPVAQEMLEITKKHLGI